MMLAQALMLCAVAASLVATASAAQEQARNHHLAMPMPPRGEISTGFILPSYPGKRFPAGRVIDIVLGIHNDGSETYNFTMIAGSLNSPADFNTHIQNFTEVGYFQTVGPGEELSLEYKFYPDPRLPSPREFLVALTAFYLDTKGQYHSTTFFNQTITIIDIPKMVDWELLSLIGLFLAVLAIAGYFLYNYIVSLGWLKSQKKRSRARKGPTEGTPVMSAEDQQDWLKGTPYDSFLKERKKAAAGTGAKKAAAAAKK
mmetsp:Transcript_17513/g.30054  ORF Transcript_17513/g.30054 Transcript_17513/m.30054 type:complete len:257 (-) Transcript_17513:618-1388(-)|eukprot:CAMPEP_0119109022 /NCGR_PEP_ID=MMETSP1180-20130426/16811_1 /TAXON_ID=3052 ORGANISM="Chlamydomonas cf sp, Strain CCMP681" /NCGR_SAMPLE_ID=MMETSP1180 /ASSEMBLY_ACC=CAM_ASM_000741 /LENGTH=256 /DNA_ID=CAMNT_0007094717 /DNA_START=81 /DNA_END=851 /DNA_ORIENTATION=+